MSYFLIAAAVTDNIILRVVCCCSLQSFVTSSDTDCHRVEKGRRSRAGGGSQGVISNSSCNTVLIGGI